MSNKKDIELVKLVLAGDISAYAKIIETYEDFAYTLAIGILKSKEDAEEVTQDAFVKAFKALSTFKGDSAFSTWLYRIVYTTAISHLRKRKPETEDIDNLSGNKLGMFAEESDDHLEKQERKIALKKALRKLKEDEAFIVLLYYYKELSVDEISIATNLSQSNVKVKLHRARKQLHEELSLLLKDELHSLR